MRCIAVTAFGALLCLSAPAQAELLVSVSKSQQRLAVTLDGAELYRWPVSTGVRGHDTPAGSFRPHDIERHWYSRQYKLTPMPWAVFFHRGYAVHGTTEAYNLGHPASHGCVRLRPDNASILYSLVRHQGLGNTKVVVMNGPLPAQPGATFMSQTETPQADDAAEHFAAATGEDATEYAAKSRHGSDVTPADESEPTVKRGAMRVTGRIAGVEAYRVSAGSDEKVLRERQAWLRALDRKYGFK